MARTFNTQALSWHAPDSATLAYLSRNFAEGASQTFPAGSPVKIASGLIVVWVSVADADIWGFTGSAGQNLASPTEPVKVVLARPEITLEANLLEGSAADHVVTADDLGAEAGLTTDANLLGTGEAGWYFQDAGTGAVIIEQFNTTDVATTTDAYKPAVGDTNARVFAKVKPGVSIWY